MHGGRLGVVTQRAAITVTRHASHVLNGGATQRSIAPLASRNPLFDATFYATRYALSALSDDDLYKHFIYTGRFIGFDPNAFFDTDWYLAQNRDLRGPAVDALDHYLSHGAIEGRDPSPAFSSWLYWMLNPDVKASGMNPLLHYLRHGREEGRHAPPALLRCAPHLADKLVQPRPGDELLDAAATTIRQFSDWTDRVLGPERPCRARPALREPALADPDATASAPDTCPTSPGLADERDILARSAGRPRLRTSHRLAEPLASRVIARRSPLLVRLMAALFAYDLAASFQAIRLLGASPRVDGPLVVFSNHPSWWDAELYAWLAATQFGDRRAFAAMDEAKLARYPVLKRLGAFPTRSGTFRGASAFLIAAERILEAPDTVLFVAAEGRFRDVRDRPIRLMPGLAHLARRMPGATFVPLAIDYCLWNERRPNLLLRFGAPMSAAEWAGWSTRATTARLAAALTETMSTLEEAARSREPRRFTTLLAGRSGLAGLLGSWRALRKSRHSSFDAPMRRHAV